MGLAFQDEGFFGERDRFGPAEDAFFFAPAGLAFDRADGLDPDVPLDAVLGLDVFLDRDVDFVPPVADDAVVESLAGAEVFGAGAFALVAGEAPLAADAPLDEVVERELRRVRFLPSPIGRTSPTALSAPPATPPTVPAIQPAVLPTVLTTPGARGMVHRLLLRGSSAFVGWECIARAAGAPDWLRPGAGRRRSPADAATPAPRDPAARGVAGRSRAGGGASARRGWRRRRPRSSARAGRRTSAG
jgi:hypothetical protein